MAKRVKQKANPAGMIDAKELQSFNDEYTKLDNERKEATGAVGAFKKNFARENPQFHPKAHKEARKIINMGEEAGTDYINCVQAYLSIFGWQKLERLDLDGESEAA